MAHQVHIGRLDITSPASLDFSGGGGDRQLRLSGKIAETDLANSQQFMGDMEKLRKEIQSQFSMLYDADGAYIGGDAPDVKDL